MVESVSAQLKRGKAIGFAKAHVPKTEATEAGGAAVGAPGRIKPVESELFHKRPAGEGPRGSPMQTRGGQITGDAADEPVGSPVSRTQAESQRQAVADAEKEQLEPEEQAKPKERPPSGRS